MIRNISHTITTRLLVILLTFAVVWMNTTHIGARGQGDVALISLGILLIVALNNFMGGGAIVYLTPRISPSRLLVPCFIWSVISAILFYLFFNIFPIVPEQFIFDVSVLGFMQSLFVFQQQVTLGKNKITQFNILVICQWLITAAMLAWMYFGAKAFSSHSYVIALYVAFGLTFVLGGIFIFPEIKNARGKVSMGVVRDIWKYSFYGQTGNIFQLLAYRMAYVFLEHFGTRSGVGIFSVGMQINEAAVTPVKSIATVQYAHMANTEDHGKNVHLTVHLLKVAFLLTMVIAGIIVALPESFYLWIFSEDLLGLKGVLNYLFWGMGGLAISSIVAHFFSGTGQYKLNAIGSLVTLGSLLILGWLFIPTQGIMGAAWASAAAYLLQALFLFTVFLVDEKPDFSDLFSFRIDWGLIRNASQQGK